MAGHNKWSKVKRVKGPLDAKRGKLFTKLAKEIIVSARIGGGNPDTNARLRQAVFAARKESMPKDNIERAIARGTGNQQADTIDEVVYEGYGPGGVAVMVEAATDNRNRTVADLRSVFKSHGGSLGETGSVSYLFTHFGQLVFEKSKYPEDSVMETALDAGAEDVSSTEESVDVLTAVNAVYQVRERFVEKGLEPASVGFTYVAKTLVPVEDEQTGADLLDFLAEVEDHDDVQRVHANLDISDTLMAKLANRS